MTFCHSQAEELYRAANYLICNSKNGPLDDRLTRRKESKRVCNRRIAKQARASVEQNRNSGTAWKPRICAPVLA